jgi:hypothetical protein
LFLPFHPRQEIGLVQRVLLSLYWLAFIPAGLVGLFVYTRRSRGPTVLLALLTGAVVVPQLLIYFSPDMRYRAPADLLLACFAGYLYAAVIERQQRTVAATAPHRDDLGAWRKRTLA